MNNNELYSVRFDIGNQHDVQEDFPLPDYMPEVRQIVSYRGTVLPENVFIDQNELVFSGIVMYNVLYVGDDGKLTSAELSSEYTAKLSCDGSELSGLSAESFPYVTQLTSCTCRATGPRRLSLSARMNTKALSSVRGRHTEIITDKAGITEKNCSAEELSLERHVLEVTSSDVTKSCLTGSVSGSFRERNDSKIITCYTTAGITDIRQDDRGVKVSGSIYLSILFMNRDGKYYTVNEHCPFEETVSAVSTAHGTAGNTSAAVRCAGLSINGDGNGDYKWEMEYDVDITRDVPYTSSLTDDVYSTSFETVCDSEDISRLVCLKNGISRLSLNSSRVLCDEGEKEICLSVGKAITDRVEYTNDGKLTVSGNCTVQALIDSNGILKAEDITVPLKFESTGSPSDGVCRAVCNVSIMRTQAKLDGNKLTVDAELSISYLAYAVIKTQCISICAVDKAAPLQRKSSCAIVYYPEENETLWEIGKKYHCKSDNIEVLGKDMPVIINV